MNKLGLFLFILILIFCVSTNVLDKSNLISWQENKELIISIILPIASPLIVTFLQSKFFPHLNFSHWQKIERNNYLYMKQFIDNISTLKKYAKVLQDQACQQINCFNNMSFKQVLILIDAKIPLDDFQVFNTLIGNKNLSFNEKKPYFKTHLDEINTTWKFWALPACIIVFWYSAFCTYALLAAPQYQLWILAGSMSVWTIMFFIRYIQNKKAYDSIQKLKEKVKYKDFFEDTKNAQSSKDTCLIFISCMILLFAAIALPVAIQYIKGTVTTESTKNKVIKNTTETTEPPKNVISVDTTVNTEDTESIETTETTKITKTTKSTKKKQ